MNLLINYANNIFRKSQNLNRKTGKKIGLFDKVISYGPKDIDQDFYNRNKTILDQTKGNGYWLWKPYFIHKALEMLNWDDFVFYCDSGSYFINPITPIIDISIVTGQEIIIFELSHIERMWTKRDAFILMDCDCPKYSESNQRLGGYSLWRKTSYTMDLINEFLNYAQDERLITDLENQCRYPNHPDFKEHRHDQSILSLLTKKHDLEAYRDPSQYGNSKKEMYPNSSYKQLIELTRRRNRPLFPQVPRFWK